MSVLAMKMENAIAEKIKEQYQRDLKKRQKQQCWERMKFMSMFKNDNGIYHN